MNDKILDKKTKKNLKTVKASDLLPPNEDEMKRLATMRDDEIDFSDIPETEFDLLPGWNYRIMKHIVNDEVFYKIHQVHYDKNGEPVLFTEYSITPYGCTKKALKKDVKRMLKAFTKPVLDYKKKT